MNEINGLWMHYAMCSGFSDLDAFHCLEPDQPACDFCPHCSVADRYEYQKHDLNSYWRASLFRPMPSLCKNHDSVKYVWFDQIKEHDRYYIWFGFMFPVEFCKDTVKDVWLNEIEDLSMNATNGFCEFWRDRDFFHCLQEDEGGCEYCYYCGITLRYELAGRVYQSYKSGFERWKDWDDLREVI